MPHPDHDAVIEAFRQLEPAITTCDRGGPRGYTHIHGPSFPHGNSNHCRNHTVVVEKFNGTVSLRRPLAQKLGAMPRNQNPISQHPLGYSHRPNFGEFDFGWDTPTLRANWRTLLDFAREVIGMAQAQGMW